MPAARALSGHRRKLDYCGCAQAFGRRWRASAGVVRSPRSGIPTRASAVGRPEGSRPNPGCCDGLEAGSTRVARFIPDVRVEDLSFDSERAVLEALASLPDPYVVLHSFPWLRPSRDR